MLNEFKNYKIHKKEKREIKISLQKTRELSIEAVQSFTRLEFTVQ